MSKEGNTLELTALEVSGASLKVRYGTQDAVHQPSWIRVSPQGLFLEWPKPPANLKYVRVQWADCPFTPHTFKSECTVVERTDSGLLVEFDRPSPALSNWFVAMNSLSQGKEADAALRTSRLYTTATVVSACGLLCGALGILLPILGGDRSWIDSVSKALLILMVLSIGAFAWIRALAGRAEVRAIGQSRG
jgi:hypothetical protein